MRYKEFVLNRIHQLKVENERKLIRTKSDHKVNELVGFLDGLEMLQKEVEENISEDDFLKNTYEKADEIMYTFEDIYGNKDSTTEIMFGKRESMILMKSYIQSLNYA